MQVWDPSASLAWRHDPSVVCWGLQTPRIPEILAKRSFVQALGGHPISHRGATVSLDCVSMTPPIV